MPHSFSLSLAAVDILLEHQNLGRAPQPFEVPHLGTTFEQRAQVRGAVFHDLETRGLAGRGRLDPDVELALRTLRVAPIAIMAVAQLDDDRLLLSRAASDGRYAVVGRQDQNLVIFQEVRPTALVASIVDLLPHTPAAGGQSVTIAGPAPKRHHANDDGYDPFRDVTQPRSTAPSQLRAVERIFAKPKLRIGQFTVDRGGRPSNPTGWFDTDEGRYFVTSRSAEDGRSWLTYAPADNARIAHHLLEQLQHQF